MKFNILQIILHNLYNHVKLILKIDNCRINNLMDKAKLDVIFIESSICKDFFQIQDHILVQNNNSVLILNKLKTKQ